MSGLDWRSFSTQPALLLNEAIGVDFGRLALAGAGQQHVHRTGDSVVRVPIQQQLIVPMPSLNPCL